VTDVLAAALGALGVTCALGAALAWLAMLPAIGLLYVAGWLP
jgi:hypothetical protein